MPSELTVALTSGTTQAVALSASGLPSGASASFNPGSGNPTYTCTCTISTTSSTSTGSYSITVTGTGGLSRSTTFTLTVLSKTGFGPNVLAIFGGTSQTLGFMRTGNPYDDSGIGFLHGHRGQPKTTFPKTDTSRVLSTGEPTWSGYAHLLTVGGRGVNPTTAYYEDNGLAPLKWGGTATNAIILRGSEAKLNVPFSSLGAANDYLVRAHSPEKTSETVSQTKRKSIARSHRPCRLWTSQPKPSRKHLS